MVTTICRYFFILYLFPACMVFAETPRPNVVLFLVDDMGWKDCGAYGSTFYETPNIDQFARQSMRFTNAYAQPLCSPTRASLLTGQYSARHGITTASGHQAPQATGHVYRPESAPAHVPMLLPESKNYLEPSQITLAEVLKGAGYRTAHIGKWHVGLTQPYWPEAQGFDVAFHCHPDPGPPGNYFSPYGVSATGTPSGKTRVGTITDGAQGEYIVDRQGEEAVKFIRESKSQHFFLNLWCYGVHGPWGHKVAYTEKYAKKRDPSGLQSNPIMASMLRSVDDCFGRIVNELKAQGLMENTIIIFASDNGGNTHSNTVSEGKQSASEDWQKWASMLPPTNNAPLREGKGTLYEGGTRVPLMWAWGDHIPKNSTSAAIVGPIDVYPTVLELVEIERPSDQVIDGVSYAKVLLGKGELERNAYFNYFPHAGAQRAGGVWVRQGDWKLIRWFGAEPRYELFNLKMDESESKNLEAEHPDRVREMNTLIDGFIRDTGALIPVVNPAYNGAENSRAGVPSAKDPLLGWKERGCNAKVENGIMTVRGEGKPGSAFLGHAMRQLAGPATVTMRVKSEKGGEGRIDCVQQPGNEASEVVSKSFQVDAGDGVI